ncbi:hypothetical protein M569_09838, partial [Genlisea aurea]
SSITSEEMGKLVVYIAENGHSYELNCHESTLVEAVQKYLESVCGTPIHDQLLLCLNMKLDSRRSLSSYELPSEDREVFLFNKARMRSNSAPPSPEHIQIVDVPDPVLPSPSLDPHPLDDAPDPALKALPSYERQFRHHFNCGRAIYSRTIAKFDICERLVQEQKVQERALEIARGNLDHFYIIVVQNYTDFLTCYSQQQRSHAHLLSNFARDLKKLRSIKLIPLLQTTNRSCLLDFVKEENLHKTVDDCSSSQRQFDNKVSEFKLEFADLKRNVENLFSGRASFLVKDLDLALKDHQRFINEQKSIMQALSKDVTTVKKLVDDSISSELSSSLHPHDAVSALGPMYDIHVKSYLPKAQACDEAISKLVDFCRERKNEMNLFVHNYMQKIAFIQYTIKDVRYKFSVFQEALKRQNDQFEHLRVVRGIGPAYRACLAEVVRRKSSMKIYMGKAGQLAERLAMERDAEIRRREEFLKVQSTYIPRDILAAMGLYDTPNSCDVSVAPFDTNLIDVDLSDVERYAPESLIGTSSKSEKPGPFKSSLNMSEDGSQPAEVEESGELNEGSDFPEIVEHSDLFEVAGTSKMEVEIARLKAELASKIALLCSIGGGLDYESLGDSNVENLLKTAADKTSEALQLKEEYEKHLQSLLKTKQMQCESYEKRIQELEQRLSDTYMGQNKDFADEDASGSAVFTAKPDETKSGVLRVREMSTGHEMEEVSCASSPLKSRIEADHDKALEGLDYNMDDSSAQLDSSMVDLNHSKEHFREKDNTKASSSSDDVTAAFAATGMAVSVSRPIEILSYENAAESSVESGGSQKLAMELKDDLSEKSSQLDDAEARFRGLMEDFMKLQRELEINQKLLDESQLNCAHLENCLHEAREEAQTQLCAADRRASEYSTLRLSAVKLRGHFERLKGCVSSAAFVDSLRGLAQSLANSAVENEDTASIAEFRDCVRVLADKVSALSKERMDFLERYSKSQVANEQLSKELEDKKELINTFYMKHQLEKQANKERISFNRLEVHEIAAFVLNSSTGHYEAINRNCPYYYLSAESVALFTENQRRTRPNYIVGQVVHIERQTVKLLPSSSPSSEHHSDNKLLSTPETAASNSYGLPVGCEYFVVTIAMLPDTAFHSLPS